jgi:hypothetical protein
MEKPMNSQKKAVLQIHALRELGENGHLIVLERQNRMYNCIHGEILLRGLTFPTLELPWQQNQRSISCIPAGTYPWQKIRRSSNRGHAIWIRDVPNRSEILVHQGSKPHHSKGCVLVPNYLDLHNLLADKGLLVIVDV